MRESKSIKGGTQRLFGRIPALIVAVFDLAGIVGEVLDEIDLPAIIRDSTGSMASETVRGVRMTGITADDAVSRVVDRALFRRRRRSEDERGGGAP